KDEWRNAPKNTPLGHADVIRQLALPLAKKFHEQNIAITTARKLGKEPMLPDHKIRAALAREAKTQLDGLRKEHVRWEAEWVSAQSRLRPFEYKGGLNETLINGEKRAELRAAKDDKARAALLASDAEYRKAALQDGCTPGLSGLSKPAFDRLHRSELERAHGEAVKMYDQCAEASDGLEAMFRTVEEAITNELHAVGAAVIEVPPPKPSEDWS